MDQVARVQVRQRAGQGEADFQAAVDGERAVAFQFGAEGVGLIQIRIPKSEIRRKPEIRSPKDGCGGGARFGFRIFPRIVRQFHQVKEAVIRAADVEDRDQVGVAARDRFVAADAVELALEGAVVLELVAPDDLHGAQRAEPRVPR
jgi:hypothetical protein